MKTPFTQTAVARAIAAAQKAGLYVVAIRPDGTVLVSREPPLVSVVTPDDWASFQA